MFAVFDLDQCGDRPCPVASFTSSGIGAVVTILLQDTPHTYARRGASRTPELDRTVGNTRFHACDICRQPSRMERGDVAGHQGQLALLRTACEGPLLADFVAKVE